MIDNQIVSRIAKKIKSIRLKKKLTIRQLAERTQVTKGLLSKIENSRTIPSLPVFVQIIHSLDISIKEFFDDLSPGEDRNYTIIRRTEYEALEGKRTSDVTHWHIVTKVIPTSSVKISLMTIKPRSKFHSRITGGFQFEFLISGTCGYRFEKDTVELNRGDSIFFYGSSEHIVSNPSDTDAASMLVIDFIADDSARR